MYNQLSKNSAMNKVVAVSKQKLSSEKVELARKPQSILSDLNKLDNKMRSQEDKMSKVYNTYKSAQKEFVAFMDDAEKQAASLYNDLDNIIDAASELGVTDFKSIDGLEQAYDLSTRLEKLAISAKKLYPSIG